MPLSRRKGHRLKQFCVTDSTNGFAAASGLKRCTEIVVETDSDRFVVHHEQLERLHKLGSGQFGLVEAYMHKPSRTQFAVKKLRMLNVTKLLEEVNSSMKFKDSNVIRTYGYIQHDDELWLLTEKMDTNLDMLYRCIYHYHSIHIPESILLYFAFCTISGLEYLYKTFNVMHRDVKPANILASLQGDIKLCDFGISRVLTKSYANTNVGTGMYLALERIIDSSKEYGVEADVWSLGLTLMELAIGKFPIDNWGNVYCRANNVHTLEPPRLPSTSPYSENVRRILEACLVRDVKKRYTYGKLLELYVLQQVLKEKNDRKMEAGEFISERLPACSEITSPPL